MSTVTAADGAAATAETTALPNKTDRNEARAPAQIMRTGWFHQVHVKSRQSRLWRSLLVAGRTVVNEMRSIENVVRAVILHHMSRDETDFRFGKAPTAAAA